MNTRQWRLTTLFLTGGSLLLLSAVVFAANGARKGMTGSYDVRVVGDLEGDGHVAVGAKQLNIVCDVKDRAGNSGKLHAPQVVVVNGKFTGTGTALGQPVTVRGRIDPPFAGFSAKILITYEVSGSGAVGRIVGTRKGD